MKRTLVYSMSAETGRQTGDLFDLSLECGHWATQMCTSDCESTATADITYVGVYIYAYISKQGKLGC